MKYNYNQHLGEQLNRLRKDGELCDVTITVGGSKIHAHKLVLAASCPYFEKMFTGGLFSESMKGDVTIKDVDEEAMETLIDFCYTSSIEVDWCNVQPLIVTADILQMVEVKVSLCSYLTREFESLNKSGCLLRVFQEQH